MKIQERAHPENYSIDINNIDTSQPYLEQLQDIVTAIDEIDIRHTPENSPRKGKTSYIVEAPSEGDRIRLAKEIVEYLGEDEAVLDERYEKIVRTNTGLTIQVKPPLKGVGGTGAAMTVQTVYAETATMLACMYYIENNTKLTSEELLEIYPNAPSTKSWLATYEHTAEVLASWLGGDKGYTYHHEDSGVFDISHPDGYPPNSIPNIHALLSSMAKGQYLNIGSKDAWNPSDMYLCRKGREHDIASNIETYGSNGDLEGMNNYLRKLTETRDLIGVSLKKMTAPKPPEEYNIDPDAMPEYNLDISAIRIPMDPNHLSPTVVLSDPEQGLEIHLYLKDSRATNNTIYPEMKAKGAQAKLGRLPFAMFHKTLQQVGVTITKGQELLDIIGQGGAPLESFRQRFMIMVQKVVEVFNYASPLPNIEAAQDYVQYTTSREAGPSERRSLKNAVQALESVYALALAKEQDESLFREMINEWVHVAKKQGEYFAPFIKLGEDGYAAYSSFFKQSLKEASTSGNPNLHMTHVDEAHIIQGPEGADKAKEALRTGFNKLTQREKVPYNVKWDGAPAVYVGWVKPEDILRDDLADQDKVFIIALKALFAKTPRVIASRRDIEEYYGDRGDLREKLIDLWESLNTNDKAKKAIPKDQIWQGDFLFGRGDLDEVEIDEEDYVVFQPNTILYAVKQSSDIGREIANADVGVVWHTRYKGKSLSDLTTSFDLYRDDIKKLKEVSGLWSTVVHGTYEGDQILGDAAKNTYESLRSRADVLLSSFNNYSQQYQQIRDAHRGTFVMQFNAMINNYVKDGNLNELNSAEAYPMFISYLENKYRAKMQRLSDQGKKPRPAEREWERVLETMQGIPEEDLREICRLLVAIMKVFKEMKMIIIEGMNHVASGGGVVRTYLVRKGEVETLEPASHEGFVITTKDNVPFKFVDREQFSRANFSDDYKKGWEH